MSEAHKTCLLSPSLPFLIARKLSTYGLKCSTVALPCGVGNCKLTYRVALVRPIPSAYQDLLLAKFQVPSTKYIPRAKDNFMPHFVLILIFFTSQLLIGVHPF